MLLRTDAAGKIMETKKPFREAGVTNWRYICRHCVTPLLKYTGHGRINGQNKTKMTKT